jgi:hypothetical protein
VVNGGATMTMVGLAYFHTIFLNDVCTTALDD